MVPERLVQHIPQLMAWGNDAVDALGRHGVPLPRLRRPAHLLVPGRCPELAANEYLAGLVRSGFVFSLFASLVMGLHRSCFSGLAAGAVAGVGSTHKDSQSHDRDDHATTQINKA